MKRKIRDEGPPSLPSFPSCQPLGSEVTYKTDKGSDDFIELEGKLLLQKNLAPWMFVCDIGGAIEWEHNYEHFSEISDSQRFSGQITPYSIQGPSRQVAAPRDGGGHPPPAATGPRAGIHPPPAPISPGRPAAEQAWLAQGHAIHQAKCATCHPFVDPSGYSEQDLREQIHPVTARKAELSPTERQAVLDYLLAVRKP